MLHKTCRGYKNTEQISHTTLGNKSAKLLNCCRTSSASSLFCSVLFEWWWMSSRVAWLVTHSSPLLAAGQYWVYIYIPRKSIDNPTGTGSREDFSPWCCKRTYQWLRSLKNFPSHHLINNDQRKAEPFFLGVHRLSWNESKTSTPTFSRSWNTDRC